MCITDLGQTVHLLCCNAFIFHVMDDQYTLTTSYNYTTKVALDKTVSYTISCIKAKSTGQVQSSLSSSLINSRICCQWNYFFICIDLIFSVKCRVVVI